MPNDDEWVLNVKRWCQDQAAVRTESPEPASLHCAEPSHDELGYEAAHPALQARHWPDASAMS